MAILLRNIDKCPYTGIRIVKGKLKLKEKAELVTYGWTIEKLDVIAKEQGITYGNTYNVTKVEGLGDCEDAYIINDFGNEVEFAGYFFEEVER